VPRLAFVFPGQGAQYKGMGKELAERYEEAYEVFAEADDIAGYKISTLCFEDPKSQLNYTEYAQPAILTTSLAILQVVKKIGLSPVLFAGLSLGEYSALVAGGAISFREALPLVQTRARLMQNAVLPGKGAMAAVIGLDDSSVSDACRQVGGVVDIANYNCPGQLVISGEKEAVLNAGEILKAAGGRVSLLAVSVPSHSKLMSDAAVKLQPYLSKVNWQKSQIDIVSNVNARENTPGEFADLLERQLYCPVLWEQSVRYMMGKVDYFIEIGPGSTLSGLIRRIDRSRLIGQVEDSKTLEKVVEKVKSL